MCPHACVRVGESRLLFVAGMSAVSRWPFTLAPHPTFSARLSVFTARLRELKVEETGVCKVVRERVYSSAWHPSDAKLLLAVGDKVGREG